MWISKKRLKRIEDRIFELENPKDKPATISVYDPIGFFDFRMFGGAQNHYREIPISGAFRQIMEHLKIKFNYIDEKPARFEIEVIKPSRKKR